MQQRYDQDVQLHSSSLLAVLSLVISPDLLSSASPEVVSADPPLASNGMFFVLEAMLLGVTGGITLVTVVLVDFLTPSSSLSPGILRTTVPVYYLELSSHASALTCSSKRQTELSGNQSLIHLFYYVL